MSSATKMYETIKYEKEDHIAIITLNRPERLNALNIKLITELDKAVDEVASDDEVRVLIITGAPRGDGRGCFSAGGDLKEMAEGGVAFMAGRAIQKGREVFKKIEDLPIPSIAAVDGPAYAGGFVLAVSCDMRIVAETAQFSDAHVRQMGLIGNDALNPRLARLVGVAKALEMSLTGDIINGEEAYRTGLANQVYPPDVYLEKAKELARKIAERRPIAVRLAKLATRAGVDMDLRQARISAYFWGDSIMDTVEGPQAFVERRKPKHG